jgi:hypothetical protein
MGEPYTLYLNGERYTIYQYRQYCIDLATQTINTLLNYGHN